LNGNLEWSEKAEKYEEMMTGLRRLSHDDLLIFAACVAVERLDKAVPEGYTLQTYAERMILKGTELGKTYYASKAAKNKRTGRASYLMGPIGDALKANPAGTWKEIAEWLEGDYVVTEWDDNHVQYCDADEKTTSITAGTFQNLITEAREKIQR
jgi:hypothetical protein